MPAYPITNIEMCVPGEYEYFIEEGVSAEQIGTALNEKRELAKLLGESEEIPSSEQYLAYFALKAQDSKQPAIKTRVVIHDLYAVRKRSKNHTVRFRFVDSANKAGKDLVTEAITPDRLIALCNPLFIARSGKKYGREIKSGFFIDPRTVN